MSLFYHLIIEELPLHFCYYIGVRVMMINATYIFYIALYDVINLFQHNFIVFELIEALPILFFVVFSLNLNSF